MSIVRIKHNKENPYVMINRQALWDDNLSLEAVGLWARLLSRPDDWHIYASELCKSCGCGEYRMYRILNELISNGFSYRYQTKDKEGKYTGYEYMVFESKKTLEEIKIILPHLSFPSTVDPSTENQALLSTKEKLSTKEEVVCYQEPVAPDSQRSSKEELIKESLEIPPELIKEHPEGRDITVKLQDIFYHSVSSKKDWDTTEIHEAWKILRDYKGLVRDGIAFISGTIKNLRNKKKSGYLAEGKKCHNKETMKSSECKENLSEKDTVVHPSLQFLLEQAGMA